MVEGPNANAREITGRRHVSVNIEALCEHLDQLVGQQVAEVIMNHHEVRLGKEDAEFMRKQNPNASPAEIVGKIAEGWRLSGVGDVQAKLKLMESGPELEISIGAPCVTKPAGSAKSFLFSHWCGVLSVILGGDFEAKNVTYDSEKDVMGGRIVPHRLATQTK
jgi:hypothetical protein